MFTACSDMQSTPLFIQNTPECMTASRLNPELVTGNRLAGRFAGHCGWITARKYPWFAMAKECFDNHRIDRFASGILLLAKTDLPYVLWESNRKKLASQRTDNPAGLDGKPRCKDRCKVFDGDPRRFRSRQAAIRQELLETGPL
jgi:hypothetical protein